MQGTTISFSFSLFLDIQMVSSFLINHATITVAVHKSLSTFLGISLGDIPRCEIIALKRMNILKATFPYCKFTLPPPHV